MDKLKFIAISGTTDVTENLYVYEYGNDMIVVDCGVGFPESEMYGVDLVIPDFSYIIENKQKLRGILVSHGHEDHLGAVPFLLKEVNAPVYSTKLVSGFIEEKLADYHVKGILNVFNPENDVVSLGVFNITPFRISHSVPDAVGFAIDTPEGRLFHVPDYKFDWTPVDSRPFDIAKAATLASSEKVLALASDCLGSTTPGYTESEYEIEGRIEVIARDAKNKIFFTTISSNISRIQQAINVAIRVGRKVCLIGHSIESKSEIAKNLGYLHYPPNCIVDKKQAARLLKDKIMYIVSGSYGQPGSNMYRLALGEHKAIDIEKGDVVIFSGDPAPPGTKSNVDFVVDRLIEQEADVHYYDMQEDLHVSGHGSQEDIKTLFALIKPKYFIPIGGTIRHMQAYKDLAVRMGAKAKDVFMLLPGNIVEYSNGQAFKAGSIPVKNVLVDGLGIGDVGKVVLRDRKVLAQDGIAIVLLQVDAVNRKLINNPEIISRGFVFQGQEYKFLEEAAERLKIELMKKKTIEKRTAREVTTNFLEKYFYKQTGRRPMILPVVVEV